MRLAGEGAEPDVADTQRPRADPGSTDRATEDREESDQRFPRAHRLRRREDFLRVQREGSRVHTPHFVVIVLPRPRGEADGDGAGQPLGTQPLGMQRLGITVTKKVAGAVGRNRAKRVLREVFRRNRSLFPEGCDVVVIGKSGAHELGYEEARAELAKVRGLLFRAAGRLRREMSRREEP